MSNRTDKFQKIIKDSLVNLQNTPYLSYNRFKTEVLPNDIYTFVVQQIVPNNYSNQVEFKAYKDEVDDVVDSIIDVINEYEDDIFTKKRDAYFEEKSRREELLL